MPRLIAVLRQPAAISALVSEPGGSAIDPFVERIYALAAVSDAVCPWKQKDVAAWRSLARVPGLSRRAGLAILRVVIGSATDPMAAQPAPTELQFGADPIDLRPHLCRADSEVELLGAFGDLLPEVSASLHFPDWHWNRREEIAALPPLFRRSFLWGLHLSSWTLLEATLSAYRSLDLERDAALRRAVARLLSFCDRDVGLEHCAALAHAEPARRVALAVNFLSRGAFRRDHTRPPTQARSSASSWDPLSA